MAKTPFKLKSGNSISFKDLGTSPVKQKPGGSVGEALDHHKKYKAKKSMPKGFNMTGSSKAGKFGKVVSKVFGKVGGKALGVLGMLSSTLSQADQPKKGKGKREYPGGKIDFTKSK